MIPPDLGDPVIFLKHPHDVDMFVFWTGFLDSQLLTCKTSWCRHSCSHQDESYKTFDCYHQVKASIFPNLIFFLNQIRAKLMTFGFDVNWQMLAC